MLPLSTGQSVACNECQAFECALVYVLLKTLDQTCLYILLQQSER
jgi:hypothetical protein